MLQAEVGESFWSKSLGMVQKVLLVQWTGVRARPGATMQVCALHCRPQLEKVTQRKLA